MSLCSVNTRSRSFRPEMWFEMTTEFLELRFSDVFLGLLGELDQPFEILNLGFEFRDVLGHGQPLDEIILELPSIRLGEIIEVVGQFAIFLFELTEFLEFFEPLTTTFERARDRRQARSRRCWSTVRARPTLRFSAASACWKLCARLCHGIVEPKFLGRELVR